MDRYDIANGESPPPDSTPQVKPVDNSYVEKFSLKICFDADCSQWVIWMKGEDIEGQQPERWKPVMTQLESGGGP